MQSLHRQERNSEVTTAIAMLAGVNDANGTTTSIPRPDLGTNKSMIAIWDAWNRLVKLVNTDSSQTLVEFVYDGRNFRVVNKEYASGTLSATRHLYYTDSWQAIGERVNTSTTPDRQHVWGIRYIDDLVLRDRDTNADGTLDERLYHLPDANWNVTAVVDAAGSVQERIEYTPYGQLQFLTPTFGLRNASSYDIRTTYTSRELIAEIKLYYFRNRWYDPGLGRFGSRDPIAFQLNEWNVYEFCNSLPLILLDSLGMFAAMQLSERTAEDPKSFPDLIPEASGWPDPGDSFEAGSEKCKCKSLRGNRMRPTSPQTKKPPPEAGTPIADCVVNEVVVVKYPSTCKGEPDRPCWGPCDASTCYEVVCYKCKSRGRLGPNAAYPNIQTQWSACDGDQRNTRKTQCQPG